MLQTDTIPEGVTTDTPYAIRQRNAFQIGTSPESITRYFRHTRRDQNTLQATAVSKYQPRLVRLFGSVICCKLLQPINADPTILVTLSGIVTFVKLLQPLNVSELMLVTPCGIVIVCKLLQSEKACELISRRRAGNVICTRLLQPENAD